jgi:hypothetical protein
MIIGTNNSYNKGSRKYHAPGANSENFLNWGRGWGVNSSDLIDNFLTKPHNLSKNFFVIRKFENFFKIFAKVSSDYQRGTKGTFFNLSLSSYFEG